MPAISFPPFESPASISPGTPDSPGDALHAKRRVLLVDDHPITRYGVRQLIDRQLNLEVCGEADSAESALELVKVLLPDAAIVDVSLPAGNGIELTRTIGRCSPQTAVLILTMHDDVLYAEESARAGAKGFLMKSEAPEKLAAALEHVLRGDTYFSPRVKEKMLHVLTRKRRRISGLPIDTLSAREREVLRFMGDGYTPIEIADRLGLSRKTVDAYREHLRHKLGIHNSSELLRYAIQWRRTTSAPESHSSEAPASPAMATIS
jgi:DNA-binding NarL/FixJ family response regulator